MFLKPSLCHTAVLLSGGGCVIVFRPLARSVVVDVGVCWLVILVVILVVIPAVILAVILVVILAILAIILVVILVLIPSYAM